MMPREIFYDAKTDDRRMKRPFSSTSCSVYARRCVFHGFFRPRDMELCCSYHAFRLLFRFQVAFSLAMIFTMNMLFDMFKNNTSSMLVRDICCQKHPFPTRRAAIPALRPHTIPPVVRARHTNLANISSRTAQSVTSISHLIGHGIFHRASLTHSHECISRAKTRKIRARIRRAYSVSALRRFSLQGAFQHPSHDWLGWH